MRKLFATISCLIVTTGCSVGPNYRRPTAPVPVVFKEPPPPSFKEAAAEGWKQSQPGDAFAKGKWWEIYNDPVLNALEEQVAISNQNVLQAEAQYRQAKAAIGAARAALFPTVSVGPAVSSQRSAAVNGNTTNSNVAGTRNSFSIPFDVSWEPDIWGSIRRNITANTATAQSFAALLENARLLYQAQLAQDYFDLQGVDSQLDLLNRTASSYQEFLTLTRNRYDAGIASDLDVAQAEAQLYGVQAQALDLGVQRAQLDHAIAVLIGKPPAESDVPTMTLTALPPPVPTGLPSELLERRPDIAAAERRVSAANEQIGIAIAAFYPNLTLTGGAGLGSSSLLSLFNWPSRVWSVGAQLAETLFDAGRRKAVVAEEQAAYDATVSAYRETVLEAFQQVEDNLAALRILEQESSKAQETIDAAQRQVNVSSAQYTAGITSYLTVITSQAVLLNAQRSAISLQERRLTASVLLIEALGGGWDTSKLPL